MQIRLPIRATRMFASSRWWPKSGSVPARFLKDPTGVLGALILCVILLAAMTPSLIAPHDPLAVSSNRFADLGFEHPMGTDNLGRDIMSRVVYGARTSLLVGSAALAVAILGGSALGLISGYVGGWVDLVSQRVVDAWQAFPTLLLAMAVVAALGPGLNKAIIAIGVTLVPGAIRVVRGSVMSEKSRDYVWSATAIGAPAHRIVLRHILPNVTAPILVLASVYLGAAILLEATLGFLGLGAQPPTISWGSMLSRGGLRFLEHYPWIAIFPGLAISLTVLALSMLGDALRDVLDPRLRQR